MAFNFDTKERAVFSKGDVARAVHASSAIPGIFTPVKIGRYQFVDGALIDPTPVDVIIELKKSLANI